MIRSLPGDLLPGITKRLLSGEGNESTGEAAETSATGTRSGCLPTDLRRTAVLSVPLFQNSITSSNGQRSTHSIDSYSAPTASEAPNSLRDKAGIVPVFSQHSSAATSSVKRCAAKQSSSAVASDDTYQMATQSSTLSSYPKHLVHKEKQNENEQGRSGKTHPANVFRRGCCNNVDNLEESFGNAEIGFKEPVTCSPSTDTSPCPASTTPYAPASSTSGSIPGSGSRSVATSGCGSKTAVLHISDAYDAEPSGGSAGGSKRECSPYTWVKIVAGYLDDVDVLILFSQDSSPFCFCCRDVGGLGFFLCYNHCLDDHVEQALEKALGKPAIAQGRVRLLMILQLQFAHVPAREMLQPLL